MESTDNVVSHFDLTEKESVSYPVDCVSGFACPIFESKYNVNQTGLPNNLTVVKVRRDDCLMWQSVHLLTLSFMSKSVRMYFQSN